MRAPVLVSVCSDFPAAAPFFSQLRLPLSFQNEAGKGKILPFPSVLTSPSREAWRGFISGQNGPVVFFFFLFAEPLPPKTAGAAFPRQGLWRQ